MTINQNSKKFEEKLYQLINDSNLPIANVYYIFQLINKQIEELYYSQLNNEAIEEKEFLPKNNNENNEEITHEEDN